LREIKKKKKNVIVVSITGVNNWKEEEEGVDPSMLKRLIKDIHSACVWLRGSMDDGRWDK
jgi:hypothetical protein